MRIPTTAALLAATLLTSACRDTPDPLGPERATRTVAATVADRVVNTLDDVVDAAGCTLDHCSLREAVAAAQDGETVGFAVTGTIQLAGFGLSVDRSIAVEGPGAERLTVRGAPWTTNFGVFRIGPDAVVRLSGLRLTGGRGPFSPAVLNQGRVVLVDLVAEDNETPRGGGIVNGGEMELLSSTVRNNRSEEGGGGILNLPSGRLLVRQVLIQGNVTETPSASSASSAGGGILNLGTLEVHDSRILDNEATGTGAFGGGVASFGGDVRLDGSAVRGNRARAPFASASGGGIYSADGALLVRNGEVADNEAVGFSAGGGGVDSGTGDQATLENVILRGNRAEGTTFADGSAVRGTGVLTIRHATIVGNEAVETSVFTAAAVVGVGTFTLLNSLVADNAATDGPLALRYFPNGTRDIRGNVLGALPPLLAADLATDNLVDLPVVAGAGFVNFGFLNGPEFDSFEAYRVLEGSVVIDRGVADGCVAVDLLDTPRPQGAACDAGAVEYAPGLTDGFVTGGGWIDSPIGAYAADPSLTGKAAFGFIARHRKGADVPEGETQFAFQAADLRFHASEYEWLVVAGSRAQFKGTGEIAGRTGSFGFLLTAVDGSPDTFRLRIVDRATDQTVYDNGAQQALGGGSIVVRNR